METLRKLGKKTSHRWVLNVSWTSIEICEEFKTASSDWNTGGKLGRYYVLNFTKHFGFGPHHVYYDGPHCSWSFGWLHYNWSGDWCKKCCPEDE